MPDEAASAVVPTKNVDIDALVEQLTLEEKVSLLVGDGWWSTKSIPRLDIPSVKVSDGPNGARGVNQVDGAKSACFPAAISLAASFDTNNLLDVGKAMADDAKVKSVNVMFTPTVCIHRDPRGGRNFESFSEDPYLSGVMATNLIQGLQSEGIGATIKHFCVNEQETYRFSMNIVVDDRTLREIYLRPFEMAIRRAKPWVVMTSFSHIGGTHASAHKDLLQNVLRGQWGFDGLVLSDFAGTYSTAPSLEAGLDIEMPGPPVMRTVDKVQEALDSGALSQVHVDRCVKRVLELAKRCGKFEDPEIGEEGSEDKRETRELIRRVGADGMVLLKNEDDILPLKMGTDSKPKSVALIGLAKSYLGHGGGSAAVNSNQKITAWEGLEEATRGRDDVKLIYAEGDRPIRTLAVLSEDVTDDFGKPGFSVYVSTPETGPDKPIVEHSPTASFISLEHSDATTVTITGTLKPTTTGHHYISLKTVGNTSVYINDERIFIRDGVDDVMAFILFVAKEEKKQYYFEAGKEYRVKIVADRTEDHDSGCTMFVNGVVGAFVGFMTEQSHNEQLLEPAVDVAKESDVAIVFVGHTPEWESEGMDKESMDLPRNGSLDKLISSVAAVNRNTIVVNSTGGPISMPWLSDVKAVIQAWLSGQESGHAMADVLLGAVSPGGKLPCTFPKSLEVTPTYDNFPGDVANRRVEYKEGVFLGYRYYDDHPEAVLFPFGHGLSYSKFSFANPKLSKNTLCLDDELTVSIDITNTGSVAASEVAQFYIGQLNPDISRPTKELTGFFKVRLAPGRTQTATVTFDIQAVTYWNTDKGLWAVDAGDYRVYIGNSSVDIHATIDLRIEKDLEIPA